MVPGKENFFGRRIGRYIPFLLGICVYTRVCNFANYRIPFTNFFIKVLRVFRVHLSQVNPFGLKFRI
ncbi:hypothetical protein Hanom_Chr12g01069671 [Helianthus anomalus]